MKVGGSSIEKALLDYCDSNALVTGGLSVTREKFEKIWFTRGPEAANNLHEYGSINNLVYDEKSQHSTLFHGHTTPKIFFDKIKSYWIRYYL